MQKFGEIINCNDLPGGLKAYGGGAGPKRAVIYQGELWLLKYPQYIKSDKNHMSSYTTGPLSEYIGSHIYRILGYDTHTTKLGVEGRKCVVLCKDFRPHNEEFYDFAQILTISLGITADEQMMQDAGGIPGPGGNGINLARIAYVLDHNPYLPREAKNRFWDMFVIDSLIGNTDRRNVNWGFLGDLAHLKVSPVFDNGSSFLPEVRNKDIEKLSPDDDNFKRLIYSCDSPFYVRDTKVNLISAIQSLKFPYNDIDATPLQKAVKRNVPIIREKMSEILAMIDAIPAYVIADGQIITIITDNRKRLYKELIVARLEKVLETALSEIDQYRFC